YCLRANAQHPRHSRNEIRRGLGAGRSFKLQTASQRSSILHFERRAGADRLRDFSKHNGSAPETTRRWSANPDLRKRFGLRSARTISAQRSNYSAAWPRRSAGEIRSAQTQTRRRRTFRSGAKTSAPEISEANRNRDLPER